MYTHHYAQERVEYVNLRGRPYGLIPVRSHQARTLAKSGGQLSFNLCVAFPFSYCETMLYV